jgi:hypothetical protein
MGLVEGDQYRHNLAQSQRTVSLALPGSIGQQLLVPEREKDFAEIIDMHE